MTSIRTKLFATDVLEEAWQRHRRDFRSSPSPGVDRVTFQEFDNKIDAEIYALSSEIATHRYRQLPLRPSFIQKDATRFRCINVPAIRDRFVQRVVLDHIRERYAEFLSEHEAFGVLRGQGAQHAIRKAVGFASEFRWVARFDIASFFDRVPRDFAAKLVCKTFRAPSITDILVGPIHAESRLTTPEQKQRFRDCGLRAGIGLRQGQPLSPLYACVYLRPLDAYAAKRRRPYVRYVDDVVIFAKTREDAIFRLEEAKELLKGLTIELSDKIEKTFVKPTQERVSFLGVDIVRREDRAVSMLPKGILEGIKRDLAEKVDGLFKSNKSGAFLNLCRHLADLRGSYLPAYGQCDDWEKLSRELPSVSKGAMRGALAAMREGLERSNDKDMERATFFALGITQSAD